MRIILASICLLLGVPGLIAQGANPPLAVSEPDARQHLIQQTEAIYPPIARAARIQGDIAITLVIDENGQVTSEKVISGPAMLQQAALDSVMKWRFAPFKANGVATQATTTLTIPFHIDKPGEGPSTEHRKPHRHGFRYRISAEMLSRHRIQRMSFQKTGANAALGQSL